MAAADGAGSLWIGKEQDKIKLALLRRRCRVIAAANRLKFPNT